MSDLHRRVLVAILVYDGAGFVPACLESVIRLKEGFHDIEILVLDDCSPCPGWSAELKQRCRALRIGYYRSPRNLGIPRSMNLALSYGISRDFDDVLLLNSDTVVPADLVHAMVGAASTDPAVASVTAWSNNASIFSLPHLGAVSAVSSQSNVDWLSGVLRSHFDGLALPIPCAVGFCMLMPAEMIRSVGPFDPIFGRGYCEELDWCMKASSAGYIHLLAQTTFVYHHGSGSTREAGMLGPGESSDAGNEALIDFRYPDFRSRVAAFEAPGALETMKRQAVEAIVTEAARRWGYCVAVGAVEQPEPAGQSVRFTLGARDLPKVATARFLGFTAELALDDCGALKSLTQMIGAPPSRVQIFGKGRIAHDVAHEAGKMKVSVAGGSAVPARH